MKLPPLALLSAPEWSERLDSEWKDLVERAKRLNKSVRTLGYSAGVIEELRHTAEASGADGVAKLVRSHSRYLNALSVLWSEARVEGSNEANDFYAETRAVVSMLQELDYAPSEIALRNLFSVYSQLFDRLDPRESQATEVLRGCLYAWVEQRGTDASFSTDPLVTQSPVLLAQGHLSTSARAIMRSSLAPEPWLEQEGISGLVLGRMRECLLMAHFIERVRSSDPNVARHEWLIGLSENPVLKLGKTDGAPFLYEAVSVMISHPVVIPAELWVSSILQLVGDPRDLDPHPVWAHVSAEEKARFLSWIAVSDLKAFLEITEKFAEDNPEMKRMFADRKKFIEGLHEQGVIKRTRLFLGNTAFEEVKSQLVERGIDKYVARIAGSHHKTAVVYIDFGVAHAIEGSHSWPFRIYPDLPSVEILSSTRKVFTSSEIGKELFEEYNYLNSDPGYERRHAGVWMGDVAAMLKHMGVKINAGRLLSNEAMRQYLSAWSKI